MIALLGIWVLYRLASAPVWELRRSTSSRRPWTAIACSSRGPEPAARRPRAILRALAKRHARHACAATTRRRRIWWMPSSAHNSCVVVDADPVLRNRVTVITTAGYVWREAKRLKCAALYRGAELGRGRFSETVLHVLNLVCAAGVPSLSLLSRHRRGSISTQGPARPRPGRALWRRATSRPTPRTATASSEVRRSAAAHGLSRPVPRAIRADAAFRPYAPGRTSAPSTIFPYSSLRGPPLPERSRAGRRPPCRCRRALVAADARAVEEEAQRGRGDALARRVRVDLVELGLLLDLEGLLARLVADADVEAASPPLLSGFCPPSRPSRRCAAPFRRGRCLRGGRGSVGGRAPAALSAVGGDSPCWPLTVSAVASARARSESGQPLRLRLSGVWRRPRSAFVILRTTWAGI